jgi:diadenosine tetraphosphate (Ap4A) HIT family hydrolase
VTDRSQWPIAAVGEGDSELSPFHDPARWVAENEYAFAIRDAYPVSPGHTLVVPKRLVSSTSELTEAELVACFKLIEEVKRDIGDRNHAKGFNIGVNEGPIAGQTVQQLHFHLIPRYPGDVADPVGGVRNIFPGRGDYRNDAEAS